MKHRYLVFEIDRHYPSGGMNDYVFNSLSLNDAVSFVFGKINEDPLSLTDYQIYDIIKDEMVYEFIQNGGKYKIKRNGKEKK